MLIMSDRTHKIKYGKVERRTFQKIKDTLEVPYFIEVQKNSYEKFLKTGIREVLADYSPIRDHTNRMELEFLDYYFDGAPKYTVKECKDRSTNYAVSLKVKARLTSFTEDENGARIELNKVEQDVYMGDFPMMTDNGSFIINGAERVIVSQLVRSPGVYCANEIDKNGNNCYKTTIMPFRGAWLEFEQDSNGILYVHVDRTRKITATVLLKALNVGTEDDLRELFLNHPIIEDTLNKDQSKTNDDCKIELYKRLKPGETPNIENITTHFNNVFYERRRYDFTRVGRYKTNIKLRLATRLEGQSSLEDVFNPQTGELICAKNVTIDKETATAIQNAGINSVILNIGEEKGYNCIGNNTVHLVSYLGEEYADVDFKALGIQEEYVYTPKLVELQAKAANKEELLALISENANSLVIRHLTIDDVVSSVSYNLGLQYGIGSTDVIDHLANRRVRAVGELLQSAFAVGIGRLEKFAKEKMAISQDIAQLVPQNLVNIRPVTAAVREFFGSSQLSQFMDQPNPIAELTHKRKLSALGPGGLNRERASVEVRDVHHSHYGRMCPIETPEGQNIGLINSLSTYARVNEYGFIEAPYRKVINENGVVTVTENVEYMTADVEDNYIVAQANEPLDENNHFINEKVTCRHREDIREFDLHEVDYMDVSPKQLISVATSLIPFLENDDINRALMGSNMQRQAVPLLKPETPIIATGVEYRVAYDSGVMAIAKRSGKVIHVSASQIIIETEDGERDIYALQKFEKSNQGTCINQHPVVFSGQYVEKGDVIADGPSTQNGELALGRNILIGFMTWEGYNYEDAILISEDLVKNDVFTSIHIEEYEIEARNTKLGEEVITRDIPNVGDDALKYLDESGIIMIGAEVHAGDILVGKVTPKGETDLTPDEKLLRAIFGEKAREVRDTSLKVPHGAYGTVVDIKVFTRANKDELSPGVNMKVVVSIAQKRKISVGDKMAGRHGNKGVISRVLPKEDMPFMADGTPLQIVLNPLGVPSRMNIGQVLEVHLGMVCKMLDWKIATPVFDGATEHDIKEMFIENGLPADGKIQLYDGRTGEAFENRVTVGYMYMIKLNHLVDDKIHARSNGPYSLVTQQPLGGKAQFGGQRFGEMEVWALEAYGAANILQEIITIKSDDVEGRKKAYLSIVKGVNVSEPGIPESFKVLIKELQALGLDVKVLSEGREININDIIESKGYSSELSAPEIGHSDRSYATEEQPSELDFSSITMDTDLDDTFESDDDDFEYNLDNDDEGLDLLSFNSGLFDDFDDNDNK